MSKSPSGPVWVPRARDYQLEFEHISVKKERASFHPLLARDTLKELARSNAKSDEKSVASTAPSDDPLRALASSAPKDDPLRTPFDPLRAPSKETKDAPLSGRPGNVYAVNPVERSSIPTPASPLGGGAPSGSTFLASACLGLSASEQSRVAAESRRKKEQGEFEMWTEKRVRILNKYTTNSKIPVSANFLDDDVKESTAPKAVDSLKSKLDEMTIETAGTAEAKNYMSQREYIKHIEEQHERLKVAWDAGERVLSLKIAIQCAKLLGDTSVPQFYPSMYILLTDILDTFGELVFQRLKSRGVQIITAGGIKQGELPANFRASDVSLQAKETCKNWFYKTACIRELMPRLYVDLCLIKSYRFLEEGTFDNHIQRIMRTIRGIGDPLAAMYARAYLCTKAHDLARSFQVPAPPPGPLPAAHVEALMQAFEDFTLTYRSLKERNFSSVDVVRKNRISLDEYIDLFSPALEWLLQCCAFEGKEDLFYAFCSQYKELCNNSAVLLQILNCFKAPVLSKYATNVVALIKESEDNTAVPKSKLYLSLGRALVEIPPPKAQRLPILNDVWKVVTKIQNPDDYIEIAEVFVQYLLANFTEREVNIFLKDVIKHAKKDNAFHNMQGPLLNIVQKIMEHSKDLHSTLSMDNFLPVLDLLEKQSKVDASKAILRRFADTGKATSDPIIIHTLMDVSRSLHDSIDSLSFEDDRRQISHLIVSFIRKIDFGRDLETQLNIYVECRQAFSNLDAVTQELVLRVALLATKAHQFMKGRHTKKTAAFVKACLAYCHITIPSLDSVIDRLRLFLQCAQVALVNQMVVQSEGFLVAAINLIPAVPSTIEILGARISIEEDFVSYLRELASFLLLFPGHPEQGPFYLIKAMLNHVQGYEPWKSNVQGKIRVYMGVLSLFCTYYQRNFPYHIDKVESNDTMYANDPAYMKQVLQYIDRLVTEIFAQLTEIGAGGDLMARKRQGTLALEFVNMLVSSLEMNPESATVVVRLYQLAKKTDAVDPAFLSNTLAHIQGKRGTWYQDIAAKILTGA